MGIYLMLTVHVTDEWQTSKNNHHFSIQLNINFVENFCKTFFFLCVIRRVTCSQDHDVTRSKFFSLGSHTSTNIKMYCKQVRSYQ